MWYVVGATALLVIAFIVWLGTSVGRGARRRDERIFTLIEPIVQQLEGGQAVTREEVLQVARRPQTRFLLFAALNELKHQELFPSDFNSPIEQAESALAYWLMHPNELQDAPERIEHLRAITTSLYGADAVVHVFRYRMPEGHWAAKDGWLLGLAGPVDDTAQPYAFLPGAFSRCSDTEGSITPEELVQWYVAMLEHKA